MLLVILSGCSESSNETKAVPQNSVKPQTEISIPVIDKKVFLTIEFYQVGKDAYSEVTPINAVLGVPKTVKWNSARCFADQKEDEDVDDLVCHAEQMPLMSKCKNEIQLLMNEIPKKYEVLDGEGLLGSIVKFNKSGGEFFVIRNLYGGTGGGRYDWSLYILKWAKKDPYFCPSTPFLSGVEVFTGSLSWQESNCKKTESPDRCLERIFYPKENAYRMEFTDYGTQVSKLPKGYLPSYE